MITIAIILILLMYIFIFALCKTATQEDREFERLFLEDNYTIDDEID